ncbi:MAG: ATP synthase F1 subunit gamma, partial [Oscillospiraceae bacterium]
ERADNARLFFDTLYDTMCEISRNAPEFSSVFTKKREIRTVLLIVIAGDRGLAGGFNSNILKLAYHRAQEISETGKTVEIVAIGKKSVEYFEKREFTVRAKYSEIAEGISIYESSDIVQTIMGHYMNGLCDSIELFYTSFLNTLTQETKSYVLLPLEVKDKHAGGKATGLTEYEPSAEAVFDSIVPGYITGILFGAIVDSFAAEQAARRTAMESASDNAGEIIGELQLVYNRARQASITQEITEIVGGAQVQS